MSSPTPEERDPQLVEALEQAIRSHSKKHYYAGVARGLHQAFETICSAMSEDDKKKYIGAMRSLLLLETEARKKSLDQKVK